MKILDERAALALLDELAVIRIACYDAEREACYAVPVAFVRVGSALQIVVGAEGRLARVLQTQATGIGIEGDDIRPDYSFRSVIGSARVQPADPSTVLAALAARYGAEWGRWRPEEPLLALELHITTIQGRDTT